MANLNIEIKNSKFVSHNGVNVERFTENLSRVFSRNDSEHQNPPARDMSPKGELKGEHF